eukprot:7664133-Pyramimonas_sp.AAC.1
MPSSYSLYFRHLPLVPLLILLPDPSSEPGSDERSAAQRNKCLQLANWSSFPLPLPLLPLPFPALGDWAI